MIFRSRLYVAVILWCLAVASFAQDSLTILCEEDWPAQYRLPDGTLTGYGVDIIRSLQARVGNQDPIRLSIWANAYKMALDEPNTLLFSVTLTKEREPLFYWVGPLSESVAGLFARKADRLRVPSLEAAGNLPRIGVYGGDFRDIYLTDKGLTNLDRAPSSTLNFQKFLAGRTTVITATLNTFEEKIRNAGGNPEDMEMVLELFRAQTFLVFSRGTSQEVVSKWRGAFEEMRADGTMARIYRKYLPGTPLPGKPLVPVF